MKCNPKYAGLELTVLQELHDMFNKWGKDDY